MRLPLIDATVTETRPERLRVTTPYLPAFPERARALGGRWLDPHKVWEFDPRDSDRVAALCTELFGYDWQTIHTVHVETIRLEVPMQRFAGQRSLFGFGRELIRRTRLDNIILGDGVLLIDGSFLATTSMLTLEVRDVPEPLLARLRRWWEDQGATVEIVRHVPQRTLPRDPIVNVLPADADPDVASILAAWKRLTAKQQAKMLLLLRETLPATRDLEV